MHKKIMVKVGETRSTENVIADRQIKLTYVGFRAHVKIASRIVSYGIVTVMRNFLNPNLKFRRLDVRDSTVVFGGVGGGGGQMSCRLRNSVIIRRR